MHSNKKYTHFQDAALEDDDPIYIERKVGLSSIQKVLLVLSVTCLLCGIVGAVLFITKNFADYKYVSFNLKSEPNRKLNIQPINVAYATFGGSVNNCPKIISRKEWGARPPKSVTNMTKPAHYAFIHHSAFPDMCSTQATCSAAVRSFQNYHMDVKKWDDIAYSFLIGGDGNVYEGRGWYAVGGHTRGYNSVGLGFCFIGNFNKKLPIAAALQAAKQLIACGVDKKVIESQYVLRGHRDMGQTECPGQMLYDLIKKWPHY